MTEWPDAPLGELVRLINGDRGKNYPSAQHRVSSGIPFINAGHLDGGRVRLAGMDYIEPKRYDLLRSGKVETGDVLLCIRGSIGRWALVTPDVVPGAIASSLVILRPGPKLLPKFLAAFLDGPDGRRVIQASDNGAAQPNIGAKEVARFRLPLPTLSDQVRIVEVLGALDDLIENNRLRVEILEEMARAIYREWFIHFRYPGHENATLIESPLGRIPDGWSVSTCGDALSFIGGGTPSKATSTFWQGGTVRWYTPSDLTKNRLRYTPEPEQRITEAGVLKSSARLFPPGSVLMTSRATLGVLAIARTEATTNQGFIVMLPDERWSPGFMREWLDAHAVELEAIGTGATFKEITKGALKRFPFVVPAQGVLDAYRSATDPIEEQIENLERQVRVLGELRDLLLPKLVTGQVDVSALDIDALLEGSVA